jgi:hypothetical protein
MPDQEQEIVRVLVDTKTVVEGRSDLKKGPKTMIDLMREEMLRRGRQSSDEKPKEAA